MNNAQLEQMRYNLRIARAGMCRLAAKLERYNLSYTGELKQILPRKQLEGVQRYVSNHALYPDIEGDWND